MVASYARKRSRSSVADKQRHRPVRSRQRSAGWRHDGFSYTTQAVGELALRVWASTPLTVPPSRAGCSRDRPRGAARSASKPRGRHGATETIRGLLEATQLSLLLRLTRAARLSHIVSRDQDNVRDQIVQRLLAGRRKLPTSSIGRLGRTAATAVRTGRMMLGRRFGPGDGEVDLDALAKIVASIGQLKGITMKVGQIMSYVDIALPDDLRAALSALQTHAQPMPTEQVRTILHEQLGQRSDALLARLEEKPLAAASIGQVHKSTLPDGTVVAVKVQYPEAADAIRSDFKPTAIGTTISSIVYPGADIDGFIEEARARFLEECDYEHEASAQSRFASLFADHPVIAVPAVHQEYCSARVLTTTWLDGVQLDTFLARDPDQPTRDRIGEALFAFYVGSLFEHRLYNCDPHPGNYLFLPDGRIGMLDYGCTRHFDAPFVAKLMQLTRAVHSDEHEALHRAFLDLGMVSGNRQYDFETARGLVRAFYGPMLQDKEQAVDLGAALNMREVFNRKRELMKLKLPGEFLFLFRIRFGLMSVLARLGARANWYRLERRWVQPTG